MQRLRIHSSQPGQLVRIDPTFFRLRRFDPSINRGLATSTRARNRRLLPAPRRSASLLPAPLAPRSMPERILQRPAVSSVAVLPPAFLPPNPKCSNGSIGRPDLLPPSDDRDWGEAHLADDLLLRSLLPLSDPAFLLSFPTNSASTSFISRCTGPRAFARFDVGSLFLGELLCFFKVDLLIHCDCTLDASITGSLAPSVISGIDSSHSIYGDVTPTIRLAARQVPCFH